MTAFLKNISPFRGNGAVNEKGQSLEEFLEEYDPYKYRNPCVTTDAVVFSYKNEPVRESRWRVLMIKRGNHPCIGWWALPGGFIHLEENLEDTAKRELEEETGVTDLPMEQIAVYGNLERDPRARVITSVYMAVVEADQVKVRAGDDAADALWYDISCRSEVLCAAEKVGEEYRKIHHLKLFNEENGIALTADVEERGRNGLICERKFAVLKTDKIACDHGAILVQAWELLESRMQRKA